MVPPVKPVPTIIDVTVPLATEAHDVAVPLVVKYLPALPV